jgi:hypothetical protein
MKSNKHQEPREKEEHQHGLMIASLISWLSKPSMVIAMFLNVVRMLLLGNGVVN